jgi:hypothetical protein
MTIRRRNCVFVALSNTVGHELIFRHYTNKVVVGSYSHLRQDFRNTTPAKKKGR